MALITGAMCMFIPLLIFLAPVPHGLTPLAWQLFAIYIGAVLGIILRPVPEPVVLIAAIAFSDGTLWLVFAAILIGQCFVETGAGRRIALVLISRFGRTSLRLGYSAMLTDLIVALAMPPQYRADRRSGLFDLFQHVGFARVEPRRPTEGGWDALSSL